MVNVGVNRQLLPPPPCSALQVEVQAVSLRQGLICQYAAVTLSSVNLVNWTLCVWSLCSSRFSSVLFSLCVCVCG